MNENHNADLNAEYQAFLNSPEYLAALFTDGANRELAFMDGPETVAGISLRALTATDLLVLQQIRSPLIVDSFLNKKRLPIDAVPETFSPEWAAQHLLVTPSDLASFLWVQSVKFAPLTNWRARWKWKRFMRSVRPLAYGPTCEAIRKFVDEAMCDRPGSAGGGVSIASWIAGAVHMLAKAYHWREADILKLPLKRLFQYERCLIAERGENAALFNRADELRGQWLDMVNARGKN